MVLDAKGREIIDPENTQTPTAEQQATKDEVSYEDVRTGYRSERTNQGNSMVDVIGKAQSKMTDVNAERVGTKEFDVIQNADKFKKHVGAVESIIGSLALLEYITDPTRAISLDPNQMLNSQQLQQGMKQGQAPAVPELYSTDPNKNQMYIAMASQLVGSLAGILGGDATGGAMAAATAGAQAMQVATADVNQRRTQNDALKKAHMAAMSKYHASLADMNKTLMTQLGQNQRKAIDVLLDIKKTNQIQDYKNKELALKTQQADVERRVKMGELAADAGNIEMRALENQRINLQNKTRVLSNNADRQLQADIKNREIAKMSLDMSLRAAKERYTKYNLPPKLDKVANYTLAPTVAVGRISTGEYSSADMNNAISFSTNVREVTNKLMNQYTVEGVMKDPVKAQELKIIRDNMVNLMEYYNGFGEVDEYTGQPIADTAVIPERLEMDFFKTAKFQFKPLASEDVALKSNVDPNEVMRSRANIIAQPGSAKYTTLNLREKSGLAKMDMYTITLANKIQQIEDLLDSATVRTRAEIEGRRKFREKYALKQTGVAIKSGLADDILDENEDKAKELTVQDIFPGQF